MGVSQRPTKRTGTFNIPTINIFFIFLHPSLDLTGHSEGCFFFSTCFFSVSYYLTRTRTRTRTAVWRATVSILLII